MTFTRTHTLTIEEKFILTCFEESKTGELAANSILGRWAEARDVGVEIELNIELILIILGQLIEREMVEKTETEPMTFTYRRA